MIDLILSNPAILDDLTRFIERIANPTPQFTASIEDAVRVGFAANFASESAGGAPWESLAFETMLDRAVHGFPAAHPILVRTGDYRASFVDRQNPDAYSEYVVTGDGWTLEIGSSDSRVQDLEGGTQRIPARPATMLSSDAENNVFATIERLISQLENS